MVRNKTEISLRNLKKHTIGPFSQIRSHMPIEACHTDILVQSRWSVHCSWFCWWECVCVGGGLRKDEEQKGTHVSLSLSTVCKFSHLHLVPTPGVVQWWCVVGILQASSLLLLTGTRRFFCGSDKMSAITYITSKLKHLFCMFVLCHCCCCPSASVFCLQFCSACMGMW